MFLLNDGLTNKISYWHLVLFLLALPFDGFYSQVVLISFVIHTLIHAKRNDWNNLLRKEVFVLASVFFLTVICTIYSSNEREAFSLLSRQAAILIFPLVLFLNRIDLKKYTKPLLLAFSFASVLVVCYLYIDALRIIRYNHLPFSTLIKPVFLNHNFSEPIGMHATYLSLYLALSLASILYYGTSTKGPLIRTLYSFSACVLLVGLIQLESRATLIALLLLLFFVAPFFLKDKKRRGLIGISILFVAALTTAIVFAGSFRTRFLSEMKEDLSENSVATSIADSRMERWALATDLIKKSPLVGYGAGDEVDLLKERYFNHKLYNSYLNKLNAHNQYISFLLTGGALALTIYLYTIFFGLRLAIKAKNFLFISFIVLIAVVSVSENILSRNKGIFFYGFFFSLFVCAHCKRKTAAVGYKSAKQTGNLTVHSYVSIDNV